MQTKRAGTGDSNSRQIDTKKGNPHFDPELAAQRIQPLQVERLVLLILGGNQEGKLTLKTALRRELRLVSQGGAEISAARAAQDAGKEDAS